VIVADRALQSVPWSALYDATHREYLVQRVELTTAPSAAVWMRNSRAVSTRTNDRLLQIEAENIGRSEAGDLARIYPEHELIAGGAATADRILRAAGGCDVLHFTGHARDAGARGEAALLIGSGDLRASQIARLRFGRPRLAVLAACSTSAMAAAFLDAGIPAVVSTLWPIEDAPSALLFTEFHRRMHGGESAAGALRDAQISMIHAGVHPAVWAAVEIQGGSA
jgi:CHAT domain-containing protein